MVVYFSITIYSTNVNFYGCNSKKTRKCFVISKQIINFAPTKDNKMARNNPKVAYLEEALSFIESIPKSAGDKLLEIVHRVELGERNPIIFSKLEGTEIWEFRTLYNKVKYRLFAFWDTQTDTLVIATHGIIKKTQKTPKKEIAKAERIRQEYFNAKNKRYGTGRKIQIVQFRRSA